MALILCSQSGALTSISIKTIKTGNQTVKSMESSCMFWCLVNALKITCTCVISSLELALLVFIENSHQRIARILVKSSQVRQFLEILNSIFVCFCNVTLIFFLINCLYHFIEINIKLVLWTKVWEILLKTEINDQLLTHLYCASVFLFCLLNSSDCSFTRARWLIQALKKRNNRIMWYNRYKICCIYNNHK